MKAILSDITKLDVDAIVNAANRTLLGGGGVDGAIHFAAGPQLLEECKMLGGCNVGEAKITKAYRLPCAYVIHTVGPVWCGGTNSEAEMLAKCYLSSLSLAAKYKCKSIAFPCISTGVFGYPSDLATAVAIKSCTDFLKASGNAVEITFSCFYESDLEIYRSILRG